MRGGELQRWRADPVTEWLLKKLDRVQEVCQQEALRSSSNEPYLTMSIVAKSEGRYDLVEEIKEMIKEGGEDE